MSDWLGDVVFHGQVGQQEDGFFTRIAIASLYPPEEVMGRSFVESVPRLLEFEVMLHQSISARCFRDLATLTSSAIEEDVQLASELIPGLNGEEYFQISGSFSAHLNVLALDELIVLGARMTGLLPAKEFPYDGQPVIRSRDGNVVWGEDFHVFDYLHLRCRTEQLSKVVGDSNLAGLRSLGYPCIDIGERFLEAMRCDFEGSFIDLFPRTEASD